MRNRALSQTIAAPSDSLDAFEISAKAEDFRRFRMNRAETLAALAALAGGKDWAKGVDALLRLPDPAFMSRQGWDAFCWRVHQFAAEWADDGLRYGWTMLDMFGCNPDPAARRVDRNGVAMTIGRMLSPLTVCAVDADGWHLADQRGSLLRYPRMERLGQVPMWQAFAPRSGP